MANVLDVARYILEKQGPMTAMKLQKLVYYCQAWSLVRDEQVLFNDEIQAWADGPVVRALYDKHKGKFTVDPQDITGDVNVLSPPQTKTIDKVLGRYAKFTAGELSDLTHKEQPWILARKGLEPLERGEQPIDPGIMQDFYMALAYQKKA